MKFYALIAIVTAMIMIIVPAAALTRDKSEQNVIPVETEITTVQESQTEEYIDVYMTKTESILSVDSIEYITGVLAGEMPATYHEEALKAQAIACATYARYIMNKGTKNLSGADISDSSSMHQSYISKNERREKWGDNFDIYESKLREIAEETQNKIITYDDEPIMAAFFSMCPGRTEDSATVFGQSLPYLKSVTSDGDKLSPNYSKKINFSVSQFEEIISKIEDTDIGSDPSEWVGKTEKTDVGTVISIDIGNKTLSGEEFRNLFDLRSSAFTISYSESGFTIGTVGYGHFVGMSQYGADYMARQGADYEEILKHYYTGVKISDV